MKLYKKLVLACGAVGTLSLGGMASTASAAFSYAYAEETVTAVTVTGTGIQNQTPGSSSTASAVQDGSGIATSGPTDTNEAYIGAGPAAPQNDYTKYSTAGGGTQAGDFTRGDAMLGTTGNLFTSGLSASSVAETFLSGVGTETSSGGWQVSGSFTTSGSSVTVGYNWANDIVDLTSAAGALAQSNFVTTVSIKDQHGHVVTSTPNNLTTSQSSPANGPEIITSGSGSNALSLSGLTAGDTYSISISGSSSASVSIAEVPEPATAGLLLSGLAVLNRRRRK